MDDFTRKETLALAAALERNGEIDAAVEAFRRAEAYERAAQALLAVRRFGEAGRLLLEATGVTADQVRQLGPAQRRLAHRAAVCFAQAGDDETSVQLFLALGDRPRAAELLRRSGDLAGAARLQAPTRRDGPASATALDGARRLEAAGKLEGALSAYLELQAFAEAGRVALRLGRPREAANLFLEGDHPIEAARCFARAGDELAQLQALARVHADDPRYREVAVQVAALASRLDTFDVHLDRFFASFLDGDPVGTTEEDAHSRLAHLYLANDFPETAREILSRLARLRPDDEELAQQLSAMGGPASSSAAAAGFPAGGFPDLPELPDAPAVGPNLVPPPPPALSAEPFAPTAAGDLPQPQPSAVGGAPGAGRDGAADREGIPTSVEIPVAATAPILEVPAARSGPPQPAAAPSGTLQFGAGAQAPRPVQPRITSARDVTEGVILAGRYRIDARLGAGGMATVYRATDLELEEVIALKLLALGDADPQGLSRFRQELSITRRLGHPNIVRFYDIADHEGLRFITMELVEARSLGQVIDGRPLEITRGIRLLLQAASGLEAAHEHGVVHRDIKPDNCLVTSQDLLKLTDFGIAKRPATAGMTLQGFVAGTPSYIAPEQITGFASVTHLSDLYSLGVTAYEMFTGSIPFAHEQVPAVLMMHLQEVPEPPSARNPEIPPPLERMILRLLEKQPDRRLPNCAEVQRVLAQVLEVMPRQ